MNSSSSSIEDKYGFLSKDNSDDSELQSSPGDYNHYRDLHPTSPPTNIQKTTPGYEYSSLDRMTLNIKKDDMKKNIKIARNFIDSDDSFSTKQPESLIPPQNDKANLNQMAILIFMLSLTVFMLALTI